MQVNAAHRCVLQTNVLSPQRTSLVSGLPRLEVEDDPSSPLNSDPSSSSALSSSLLSSQTLTRTSYPLSRVVQYCLLHHYPSSTRHCISNIPFGVEPHIPTIMRPERAFKQYIIHPHRIPFNSVRSLSIRSSFSTTRNHDSLTTDARTNVANDVW